MTKKLNNIFWIILAVMIISCKQNKVYEKFEVEYSINENLLNIKIVTDLPDDVKLSLSVNRSLWEKGDLESPYSIEYFSEYLTVGELKKSRQIVLDQNIWQANLSKKQKELASSDIDLEVEKISDSIDINTIAMSSNIPELKFKDGKYGINETFIYYPLKRKININSEYGSFQSLKIGKTYSISSITPLMPELNPTNSLEAVAKMKELPIDSRIIIIEVSQKRNRPWYKVKVVDTKNNFIAIGWINSLALLRQELRIIK